MNKTPGHSPQQVQLGALQQLQLSRHQCCTATAQAVVVSLCSPLCSQPSTSGSSTSAHSRAPQLLLTLELSPHFRALLFYWLNMPLSISVVPYDFYQLYATVDRGPKSGLPHQNSTSREYLVSLPPFIMPTFTDIFLLPPHLPPRPCFSSHA